MRWIKLLERYSLVKRPTLKVVNPRVGTSIIPLSMDDSEIFFQYLTNKIHSLYFEGSEGQLTSIIHKLKEDQGFTIQKMKTSIGRGREKLMLLHLKFPNDVEIRRVIKLS
ncbi:hypothetical protein ACJVC5_19345 [Peredibacter sp. HCB2-198]|uniref:hypothetical protein n=1 Tax=Peredibacter sp. HCB2-198 TaxID=3383025 RepID=UPI0038B515A2